MGAHRQGGVPPLDEKREAVGYGRAPRDAVFPKLGGGFERRYSPGQPRGMLEFLSLLRKKGISYRIQQQVDDGLEVSFDLVGCRIEATFFADRLEFSYFLGTEDVETDPHILLQLIDRYWKTS
jgi:hypothetical protein